MKKKGPLALSQRKLALDFTDVHHISCVPVQQIIMKKKTEIINDFCFFLSK